MKKRTLILLSVILYLLFALLATKAIAQNVGINSTGATPNSSAMLDIDVSGLVSKKGLLIPRVPLTGTADVTTIISPATSLLIYNTATAGIGATAVTPGYYYWNGAQWNSFLTGTSTSNNWLLSGNSGTTAGTNFIGTTDAQDLVLKQNNDEGLRLTAGGAILATGNSSSGITPASGAGKRMMWIPAKAAFRVGEASGSDWDDTNIGTYSIAMGYGSKSNGYSSVAIGEHNWVIGGNSAGIGWNNYVTGNASLSIGTGNTATADNATAIGTSSTASATYATAVGSSAIASGKYSNSFGTNSLASADSSFALGNNTIANGVNAVAMGNHISANNFAGSFILGDNSTYTTTNATAANQLTARFNGGYLFYTDASLTASNTIVFKNGNVGIGNLTPAAKLDVVGKTRTQQFQLTTGPVIGYVLTSDNLGNGSWVSPSSLGSWWKTTGNSGTTTAINFIGTTDSVGLVFKVNNHPAGKIGLLTNWDRNTSFGNFAFASFNGSSTGSYNTAIGTKALYSSTDGYGNVAVGDEALTKNIDGDYNTALGLEALYSSTSASYNTAIGNQALYYTTTGENNVAIGWNTMNKNTTGGGNTAVGGNSLSENTIGKFNTAMGEQALNLNTKGINNTGVGVGALIGNTTSSRNTAIGSSALPSLSFSNGSVMYNGNNVAVGDSSLYGTNPTSTANGINNTAIGTESGKGNATGFNNTFLGYRAVGTAGISNSTAIGANAYANISNAIVLGSGVENIGIGTSSPSAKLEVAGQVKITGGTPGAGKVLVSDAVGLASWQTVAGVGGQWMLTGNTGTSATTNFIGTTDAVDFVIRTNNTENMRVTAAGNIGVGTTAPPTKFTVLGAPNSPSIPGTASTAMVRVAVSNMEGIDIGKLGTGSFAGWIQAGYNGSADPMSLQPLGGNLGVGTSAPGAILDINGTTKVGTLGTVLTNIIRSTNNIDVASVAANSSLAVSYTVTNAAVGSTVSISPASALNNGLVIAYARVSAAGTVEVKFTNVTGAAIDPPLMNYYITVIQ